MIYLQDIFQSAVTNISTGSDVTNIAAVPNVDFFWTFETANKKNIAVDLDVLIGDNRYTVTNIAGKVITISGSVAPTANSWNLAFFFRFGHTIEINQLLEEAKKMDVSAVKKYPFIWLMLNNDLKPLPNFGKEAYETEAKIAFVNVAQQDAVAATRLTNNFKKILDKIFDLFFHELNELPTAANFNIKLNEPIQPTFVDRFFYGSADKKANVFGDAQTDAIECKFNLQVVPVYNCNYSGLK